MVVTFSPRFLGPEFSFCCPSSLQASFPPTPTVPITLSPAPFPLPVLSFHLSHLVYLSYFLVCCDFFSALLSSAGVGFMQEYPPPPSPSANHCLAVAARPASHDILLMWVCHTRKAEFEAPVYIRRLESLEKSSVSLVKLERRPGFQQDKVKLLQFIIQYFILFFLQCYNTFWKQILVQECLPLWSTSKKSGHWFQFYSRSNLLNVSNYGILIISMFKSTEFNTKHISKFIVFMHHGNTCMFQTA